jgi:hypothetical protein
MDRRLYVTTKRQRRSGEGETGQVQVQRCRYGRLDVMIVQ